MEAFPQFGKAKLSSNASALPRFGRPPDGSLLTVWQSQTVKQRVSVAPNCQATRRVAAFPDSDVFVVLVIPGDRFAYARFEDLDHRLVLVLPGKVEWRLTLVARDPWIGAAFE